MDRKIVYPSQQPTDAIFLKDDRAKVIAHGLLSEAILGASTVADGLSCIPMVPASLTVQVLPGSLYTKAPLDSTAYGSIGVDNVTQIVKQGTKIDVSQLTLVPPATIGHAINYLIQAQILESDADLMLLSYFNSEDPEVPLSGPGGSGASQATVRQCRIVLSAKAGASATAGSQVTPAPDAGYVGLWSVTVAQGATQLTGAQIVKYVSAPFIDVKLPDLPRWVQGGSYAYANDSGTANQIVVNVSPVPLTVGAGFVLRGRKIATPSNGAMTVLLNGVSYPLINPDGSAMSGTTPMGASFNFELFHNGTAFVFANSQVAQGLGSLTASAGEGISVSGGGVISLNFSGLTNLATFLATDIFARHVASVGHRGVTWLQLLAGLAGFFRTGQTSEVHLTTAGTHIVPVPAWAKEAAWQAWAGGGAGGNGHNGASGGGGGGGEYGFGEEQVLALTGVIRPGENLTVVVGQGGPRNVSNGGSGSDGGNTTISTPRGLFASVVGGKGGIGSQTPYDYKDGGIGGTGGLGPGGRVPGAKGGKGNAFWAGTAGNAYGTPNSDTPIVPAGSQTIGLDGNVPGGGGAASGAAPGYYPAAGNGAPGRVSIIFRG